MSQTPTTRKNLWTQLTNIAWLISVLSGSVAAAILWWLGSTISVDTTMTGWNALSTESLEAGLVARQAEDLLRNSPTSLEFETVVALRLANSAELSEAQRLWAVDVLLQNPKNENSNALAKIIKPAEYSALYYSRPPVDGLSDYLELMNKLQLVPREELFQNTLDESRRTKNGINRSSAVAAAGRLKSTELIGTRLLQKAVVGEFGPSVTAVFSEELNSDEKLMANLFQRPIGRPLRSAEIEAYAKPTIREAVRDAVLAEISKKLSSPSVSGNSHSELTHFLPVVVAAKSERLWQAARDGIPKLSIAQLQGLTGLLIAEMEKANSSELASTLALVLAQSPSQLSLQIKSAVAKHPEWKDEIQVPDPAAVQNKLAHDNIEQVYADIESRQTDVCLSTCNMLLNQELTNRNKLRIRMAVSRRLRMTLPSAPEWLPLQVMFCKVAEADDEAELLRISQSNALGSLAAISREKLVKLAPTRLQELACNDVLNEKWSREVSTFWQQAGNDGEVAICRAAIKSSTEGNISSDALRYISSSKNMQVKSVAQYFESRRNRKGK